MRVRLWWNHGLSTVAAAAELVALGAARAAKHVDTIASHRDGDSLARVPATERFLEPLAAHVDGAVYAQWCLEQAVGRGVDLFWPQAWLAAIADAEAAFSEAGIRLMLPADGGTLRRLQDKALVTADLRVAGLPVPETHEAHDLASFDAAVRDLLGRGRTVCVKPPHGIFGAGFWRLTEGTGLYRTLTSVDTRDLPLTVFRSAFGEAASLHPERVLVMEHLAGPEWSVDVLARRGTVLRAVARRKEGRARVMEVDGPAIALARDLVALYGLSQVVNVQLRAADAAGHDLRVLEVNTRMSGGMDATRVTGANLAWEAVAEALGWQDAATLPPLVGGARTVASETWTAFMT